MGQGGRGQLSCYPGSRAYSSCCCSSSPDHQITEKYWTRAEMPSSIVMAETSHSEASTSGSSGAYIEHTVTRLDTLAGVAIKYGVEVMLALQETGTRIVVNKSSTIFSLFAFLGRALY